MSYNKARNDSVLCLTLGGLRLNFFFFHFFTPACTGAASGRRLKTTLSTLFCAHIRRSCLPARHSPHKQKCLFRLQLYSLEYLQSEKASDLTNTLSHITVMLYFDRSERGILRASIAWFAVHLIVSIRFFMSSL